MSSELLKHPFVQATRERAEPFVLAGFKHVRANPAREDDARSENRARMDVAEQYQTQVLRQALARSPILFRNRLGFGVNLFGHDHHCFCNTAPWTKLPCHFLARAMASATMRECSSGTLPRVRLQLHSVGCSK